MTLDEALKELDTLQVLFTLLAIAESHSPTRRWNTFHWLGAALLTSQYAARALQHYAGPP